MSERDLLRVLMEDAELTPYGHGGGRLAITRDDNRELIADFYGNGEWREFFMELIRAESKRRSAQETRAESEKVACRCPTNWCRLEPDNGAEQCPDLEPHEVCAYRQR